MLRNKEVTHGFHGCRLKLKRAKEHIDNLSFQVHRFCDSGAHKISVERDPNTGYEFLKIVPANMRVPDEFSLVLGDAIHNLASALDHAWFELTAADAPKESAVKFPFRPTAKDLETFFDKGKEHKSLFAMRGKMLDQIQPYKGGNGDALYLIHHFDIADKHKLLIPQAQIGMVKGIRCEDGDGVQFQIRTRYFRDSNATAPCGTHRNVKVIDQGQCTATVVVTVGTGKEKTRSIVPVITLLTNWHRTVANILTTLGF